MEKLNNEDIKRLLSETTVDIDLAAEWDSLEAAMDKSENKRRGLWWWLSAMPLIVLGLYLLVPKVGPTQTEDNTQVKQINVTPSLTATAQNDVRTQSNSKGLNSTTLNEGTDKSNSIAKSTSKGKTLPTNNTRSTAKQYISNENNTKSKTATIYTVPNQTKTVRLREYNSASVNQSIYNQELISTGNTTAVNKSMPRSRTIQITTPIAGINSLQPFLVASDRNRPLTPPEIATILIAPQGMIGRYIYVESAVSQTDISSFTAGSDLAYQQRLSADYTALSKSEVAVGVGYHFNDRLSASAGIYYRQYRSVYRGDFTSQSTELIPTDTAKVLTNIIGGTITQAGEVTRTTTMTTTLQQYNYHHGLGLQLAARYRVLGPVYVGANMAWTPVLWQSGQILSPNNTLQPLADVSTSTSSLNAALELGWQSQISKYIGLDVGLRYQPKQQLSKLADTGVQTRAIGANVRLMYMW